MCTDNHSLFGLCVREGFDFRVSQPGGALGTGAYFARCSGYSATYSVREPHAVLGDGLIPNTARIVAGQRPHAMLLCRVLLGRVGPGAQGLRKPPAGADSVSDTVRSIFAIFDNAQAYPEYMVEYRGV